MSSRSKTSRIATSSGKTGSAVRISIGAITHRLAFLGDEAGGKEPLGQVGG